MNIFCEILQLNHTHMIINCQQLSDLTEEKKTPYILSFSAFLM